jgi:hypothetical protein
MDQYENMIPTLARVEKNHLKEVVDRSSNKLEIARIPRKPHLSLDINETLPFFIRPDSITAPIWSDSHCMSPSASYRPPAPSRDRELNVDFI